MISLTKLRLRFLTPLRCVRNDSVTYEDIREEVSGDFVAANLFLAFTTAPVMSNEVRHLIAKIGLSVIFVWSV